MMTLALTLLAMLAVGVSLGLLGGGGSILTVPILVYVAGVETNPAAPRHALFGTPGGYAALGTAALAATVALLKHRRKAPEGRPVNPATPRDRVRQ
ncbi:hypothetical protein [Actinomadura monticuli]|uniref:Uncharacterized protein n=1 Tax=Actinomadura monticuli TaxID=3097367 RepID=A0ABV4QHQ9_9ACTN